MRPTKDIRDVEVKSIQKRWKEKTFAAGVDRAHVEAATADFSRAAFAGGLELWTHVGHVLAAMQCGRRGARARRPAGATGVKRRLPLLVAAAVALAIAWSFRLGGERQGARLERLPVGAFGDFVAAAATAARLGGPAANVVLLVGDGLGLAQLAAARIHAYGPDGRLRLERLPVLGLVATHPAGALVAKSDAAATALATGEKTANGRIAVDRQGRPLRSLRRGAPRRRRRRRPGDHFEPGGRDAGGVRRPRRAARRRGADRRAAGRERLRSPARRRPRRLRCRAPSRAAGAPTAATCAPRRGPAAGG